MSKKAPFITPSGHKYIGRSQAKVIIKQQYDRWLRSIINYDEYTEVLNTLFLLFVKSKEETIKRSWIC